MEYDLIRGLAELALSEKALAAKLKDAAAIALEFFGADQALIYLADGESGTLALKAASGDSRGRVKAYAAAEGIPAKAMAEGGAAEAHEASPGAPVEKAGHDKGMTGFRSGFACPVRGAGRISGGVLFVKYHDGATLSEKKNAQLELFSTALSTIISLEEERRGARRMEEEIEKLSVRLKNAEKFMALGDMAATLAHEIKNPLVSIGGFASRVKRKLPEDSPAHKYVDQMIEEVKRLEKVSNGALRVLKEDRLDLKLHDVNEIVCEAAALFDDDFEAHGIEVVRDLTDSRLSIMADKEQLKIAFDNLIANAIQSMDTGGTLRLSTELYGDWIVAEVEDSGGGIDPRHVSYIFTPFFTTKERGTGLGLPITHSIIMRHKGEIDVINKRGMGVLFSIRLPRADKKNIC